MLFAGKTTLISILTGVNDPSAGRAYVGGFDVQRDRDAVKQIIGICPQHDVVWEVLHLFAAASFVLLLRAAVVTLLA